MMCKTMITAHSGCDGTPDNSIEFIKTALKVGAEAFEVDVNKGSDGVLYLRHDPDPTDKYVGCSTLGQAFKLLKPYSELKINCDLKMRGIEVEVFELAQKMGVDDRLIYSGSVGFDFLEEHMEITEKVEVFLNIEEIFQEKMCDLCEQLLKAPEKVLEVARKAVDSCKNYNIRVLNVNYLLCTDEFMKALDESEINISAWTVNDEADIVRLLNRGLRNITTRRAKDAVFFRMDFMRRNECYLR